MSEELFPPIAYGVLAAQSLLVAALLVLVGWSLNRQRLTYGAFQDAIKERDRLRERRDELRAANHAFKTNEGTLRQEIADRDAEIRKLVREGASVVEHSILLMGPAQAGKTTWLARVANPALSRETLIENRIPNAALGEGLGPVPVVVDRRDPDRLALHAFRFYDMAGEKPEQLGDNLERWMIGAERAEGSGAPRGQAAVLLVWDLTLEGEKGKANELRVSNLRAILGTERYRKRLAVVHTFLNKRDLLVAEKAEQNAGEARRTLTQLADRFQLDLTLGSALTGEGVADSLGKLCKAFGLAPLLPAVFAGQDGEIFKD